MFSLMGFDPAEVFTVYFIAPLDGLREFSELLLKASTLILIALGLSFAFKANVWNIGAEGQYVIGALSGASVALLAYAWTGAWTFFLTVFAGVLGGVAWAMIPAVLKLLFRVNEILSSLMLNYIALQLLLYLTHGALKDSSGSNFPESEFLDENLMFSPVLEGTRLHAGFFVVAALLLLGWFCDSKSLFGFGVKIQGLSEKAAKFSGVGVRRTVVFTMALSGGLAGLAGIMEIVGPVGQITANFASGYGYTAIIVAFLGRLHPVGITLAGLAIALTSLGGEVSQILLGLPLAATGGFQSLLLFFLLGGDFLRRYRFKFVRRRRNPT